MKKLIGKKSEFAIEYDLIAVTGNGYYLGNIWFWINNFKVGEDAADTYLSTCIIELKNFVFLKDVRRFNGSPERDSDEMFKLLYKRFFNVPSKKDSEYSLIHIFQDIFWLSEAGDANFRDYAIVILLDEPEKNRQRLIWQKYTDSVLHEHFIEYGVFEEVAISFINTLNEDVKSFVD